MKLTILGSGTVVPDGARNSAGYFVEFPGARIMLDCGAGTVHALPRYKLRWEEMTHLFISHFHVDHAGELASLFYGFKWGMRNPRAAPIALLGPRGLDRVMDGLKHAFGEKLFEPGFPVNLRMLAPGERMEIGEGGHLSVAKTPHTEESLAVRIEHEGRSLCYTGDTEYSEHLSEFFSKADLLISECSFRERREGIPHLTIKDAAKIASDAGVARLIVTHFYFDFDEAELKRELERDYSGEAIIGRDGMSLDV